MRAMRAALLWALGVAAVLLAPVTAAPATSAAFAHRPVSSISSGQHATRPSPTSSGQRSGAAESQLPALASTKAGSSSGLTGPGAPGVRAHAAAVAEPSAGLQLAGPYEPGPRTGLDPGAHLGRSPPATLGA